MIWKPEVEVSGIWYGNGLCFASREEAEGSARALFYRWTTTGGHRAVEVDTAAFPVNYVRVDDVDRPIKQKAEQP